MAFDEATIHRSRRAILFGTMGAVGALAARALPGASETVNAATGDVMEAGHTYTANAPTGVNNTAESTAGYFGTLFAGVQGTTESGMGVQGQVLGNQEAVGVQGITGGYSTQVAVDADCLGGKGEGYAVRARTKNGIGVYAEATGGAAIVAHGVTEFSRSGKTTFFVGQTRQTMTAGRITADTLVVATVQGAVAGVWVLGVAVNVANQNFTIRLNKAAPKTLKVGWFVVN